MAVTTATSASNLAPPGSQTNPGAQTLAGNFSTFLQLLTTQLKSQDPTSPMDATQFTQQLVQFASVEQAVKSNQQLTTLTGLLQTSTMTNALDYIGTQVEARTAKLSLPAQDSASLRYSLPSEAETATLTVKNASNRVVATIAVDGSKGAHEVAWDGKDANGNRLPAGEYGIELVAKNAKGEAVAPELSVRGTVGGIENRKDGLYLLIGGIAVRADGVSSVMAKSAAPGAA